jgi:hypothetical protein
MIARQRDHSGETQREREIERERERERERESTYWFAFFEMV